MCCNVCCASAGGAAQVPEGHLQQTGGARLAPQQSHEVHRRQKRGPGLWAGRTGVSAFTTFINYPSWICSYFNAGLFIHVCPLCPQSFCASLHQELKEYYRLLSVLHSQVLALTTHFKKKLQLDLSLSHVIFPIILLTGVCCCMCVSVAGGGWTRCDRVHREQPDPQEAAGLDVRPQSSAQNAGRPRRLLPRWAGRGCCVCVEVKCVNIRWVCVF